MAQFTRHVGKHGDRKVAIIFREVPGEPHMCLVTHTELLNKNIHDPLIKCIESDIGQTSENLADALNRSYTQDGKPILQTLHVEGQIKKVQTSQIIMTPAPNTKIKLEDLNKILNEMKLGEEAVKKLAEMDSSLGMQVPAEVARRMRGQQPPASTPDGVLGDAALATQRRQQAEKMKLEATGLIAEADRLLQEAIQLDPAPAKKVTKSIKSAAATIPKIRKTRAKVAV